jgi:hypothetical protein
MNVPDQNSIREYLLGLLPESECGTIEEKLFTQQSFRDEVGSVEDQIIEDYLEDRLSASDKLAVENHFLQPPERRKKLRFIRMLRASVRKRQAPGETWGRFPRVIRPVHFYTITTAAAVLFIAASALVVNTVYLQQKLDTEIASERSAHSNLEQQLREAQSRIRNLQETSKNLQNHTEQEAKPIYLSLNLSPIQPRGETSFPRLKLKPDVRGVEVHLPIIDVPSSSYRATLRSAGQKLATADKIKPVNIDGGMELIFRMSYPGLVAGDYEVEVVGNAYNENASNTKTYNFIITK